MSLQTARRVLRIEAEALTELLQRLDANFERAVELLLACKGRVVVIGMGKSGLIGRKIAATFSSTGTPSAFLHPAEALHGDLGMLMRDDVVMAVSYGGETEEIIALLETIKRLGLRMIALTGSTKSTIAAASDVVLDVSVKEEACSLNLAPTASTTTAMAMGDALAVSLLDRRGFSPGDFAALHPGGRLGKKLLRVENLMHSGDAMPRVPASAKMPDVIYEISKKKLGMTTVLDAEGRLAGILTDGDLRRLMQERGAATLELVVGDCMNRAPQTLAPSELAGSALRIMEDRHITSVIVVDAAKKPLGVVHLHDLWTLELF
ncbi:MAG TPA: KpsF/GutQ family sugar-phosphate isomerase [Verrucomicrobiae bacterium]|jgi:arabinose-5-phosphate isomerase|nr:KpsF/GutQ family sugar-phosphate isomerase [Verrucomicrobiae bacterium]